MNEKTSYLTEALYGNYPMYKEDRLSQVFSASFNHSPLFQKAVLRFFKLNLRKKLEAETQIHFPVDNRLDILISSKNAKQKKQYHIVIENKVDDRLKKIQLGKYDKIPELKNCKKRFCFVKHYTTISAISNTWEIRYWGDFCIELQRLNSEDFFINNFIDILKDYGMEKTSTIKNADLKKLSKALWDIRFNDKPAFTYNGPIFETLVTFKGFLKDVFDKAAKEPLLLQRAGNFRPNLKVSYWYEEVKQGKEWIWIGCEVELTKPHKGIKAFGAALLLYNEQKNQEKYKLITYVTGMDNHWKDWEYYPKKDIDCLEFEHWSTKFWKRKLK